MSEMLEALNRLWQEGLTLMTLTTFVIAIIRWIENVVHRKRIERMQHTVNLIAEKVGVTWDVKSISKQNTASRAKKSFGSYRLPWADATRARHAEKSTISGRLKRMNNQNINYVTLVVALLGAAKLVLQVFGIDIIDDDMIDKASNAVAAIVTLVGVIYSHRKGGNAVAGNYDFTGLEAHTKDA